MNFRDVEILSAYLDGRLSTSDAARLEKRLASDASLKATLEDLRETQGLLRRLPQRRAPRNFRLTPKMAGIRPPEPRATSVFRLATALAAFLFVASVALNAFTPFAAERLSAAAPAPAYGLGGGGGGIGNGGGSPEEAPPAATSAPVLPFAAVLPTPTLEGTRSAAAPQAQDSTQALGAVAPTAQANKASPLQPGSSEARSETPIPLPWVVGLGALMIVCAAAAWLVQRSNERRVRSRWNQK